MPRNIAWIILYIIASLPLCAETLRYPVPPFRDTVWRPPITESVWIEPVYDWVWRSGGTSTRWVDPDPYWIPTTYKTVSWPDEYRDDVVPAVIGERWVESTYATRTIPAYTVNYPEEGHDETTPESTGTREIERTGTGTRWVESGYYDYGYIGSYWDDEYGWVDVEDWYWVDTSGYEDYEYTYTDTETYTIPASTVYVVDREAYSVDYPEREELYEVSQGYYEDYVVTPETTNRVLVRAAGSAEVVDVEGRWVDPEPYQLTETLPGYNEWAIVTAGYEEERTTEGRWENIVVPESTLTVLTDDVSNITATSWIPATAELPGYSADVPYFVDRFLADPEWSAEYAEDDDGTAWNEALCFTFRGRLLPQPPGTQPGQVVIGGSGKWETRESVEPVGLIEARALLDVFLLDVAIKLREKRGEVYSYLTYEKYSLTDPKVRVYAGKTVGVGEPLTVMHRRELNHYWKRTDLAPGIINSAIVTRKLQIAAEFSMRGREQSLIDWHDQSGQLIQRGFVFYTYEPSGLPDKYSRSDNMRPTETRPNGMRAVDKYKEDGKKYWEYSVAYFGYLWEFTGDPHADLGTLGNIRPIESLVSLFVRPPLSWTPL